MRGISGYLRRLKAAFQLCTSPFAQPWRHLLQDAVLASGAGGSVARDRNAGLLEELLVGLGGGTRSSTNIWTFPPPWIPEGSTLIS